MSKKQRKFKYSDYVTTSISAAKASIDSYNRVDYSHKQVASLVFLGQAWELLGKALIIKKENYNNIFLNNGKSITAEKALNKVCYKLGLFNKEELGTLQQVISLRNAAMHDVLPRVPAEIMTHLLYFSLRIFRKVLKSNFNSYYKGGFDKNFLSISFDNHTFYSDKVSKLFKDSRKYGSENNRLLYLLERGIDFASRPEASAMQTMYAWHSKMKKLPRKSRPAMHLGLYKHLSNINDVRFVPVETAHGEKAEVTVSKAKTKKEAWSVLYKKSDPNKDYPHLTSELATKLGKNTNFIARTAAKLGMKENKDYCYLVRMGKTTSPKYSDASLSYLKKYLEDNPDFSPYAK